MTHTTTTFRAAYLRFAHGGTTVLTGPEHAHFDDAALRAEARAEADRMGIVRDDYYPNLSPEEFRNCLQIGSASEGDKGQYYGHDGKYE